MVEGELAGVSEHCYFIPTLHNKLSLLVAILVFKREQRYLTRIYTDTILVCAYVGQQFRILYGLFLYEI